MSLFSIVYLYTHSFNDVIVPHDVFHYHLRTKKMRRWQRTMIPQDHPLQWQRQNQSQAAAPLVIMEALVRTSLGYQATFSNNFTAQKKNKTHQAAQTWYCMKRASQSTKEAWLKATWLWMKGQTPVDPPWGDSWQRTILIWTPRICKHLQWH